MKTLSQFITVFSLVALAGPSTAQLPSPPAKEVAPSVGSSPVERDGVVVYRGQPFLVRHGRAALINRALVPEGQVLTWEGRLVPLPSGFSIYDTVAVEKDGILVFGGQAYWLHNGQAALINNTVVPEGQVLTAQGTLAPLPADFSGFIHDNGPAGVPLPLTTELGTQALPNQAGIPQALKGTGLESGMRTPSAGGGGSANVGATGRVGSPNGAEVSPGAVGASVNAAGIVPDNVLLNNNPALTSGIPAANGTIVGGSSFNADGDAINAIPGGVTSNVNGAVPASALGGMTTNLKGGLQTTGTAILPPATNGAMLTTTPGSVTPTFNGTARTKGGARSNSNVNAQGTTTNTAVGSGAANTAGQAPSTTPGESTANTAGGVPATAAGGGTANTAGGVSATTAGGTPANTAGGTRAPMGNTAGGTRAPTGNTAGGRRAPTGSTTGGTQAPDGTTSSGTSTTGGSTSGGTAGGSSSAGGGGSAGGSAGGSGGGGAGGGGAGGR